MLSRWAACRYKVPMDGYRPCISVGFNHLSFDVKMVVGFTARGCLKEWSMIKHEYSALGHFLVSKIFLHLGIFRIPIVLLQPTTCRLLHPHARTIIPPHYPPWIDWATAQWEQAHLSNELRCRLWSQGSPDSPQGNLFRGSLPKLSGST